jgi:hypothetical protein
VTAPVENVSLNLLPKDVMGKKAKIKNGQPRITPIAATATIAF